MANFIRTEASTDMRGNDRRVNMTVVPFADLCLAEQKYVTWKGDMTEYNLGVTFKGARRRYVTLLVKK